MNLMNRGEKIITNNNFSVSLQTSTSSSFVSRLSSALQPQHKAVNLMLLADWSAEKCTRWKLSVQISFPNCGAVNPCEPPTDSRDLLTNVHQVCCNIFFAILYCSTFNSLCTIQFIEQYKERMFIFSVKVLRRRQVWEALTQTVGDLVTDLFHGQTVGRTNVTNQ